MNKKHDIETYSKLAQGASFFLHESFHHINESLTYELAGIIFSNELESIDVNEKDKEISGNLNLPSNPVELLQENITDVLSGETLHSLSEAWSNAQMLSKNKAHKFDLTHRINSINMLGHLNNFGFFVETLTNRHLLFLQHSGQIDNFIYTRISVAKIMERLIFIFKDELNSNTIHLNEIVNLFSLRNKTVHYTPDNAIALKPKVSELLQIWTQTSKVLKKMEKVEMFNDEKFSKILDEFIQLFKERWT